VKTAWDALAPRFPGVAVDYSGELDDIQESLDAMLGLFLLGLGLIYLILAAQFRSYWQPLMILATVPMAFTGVAFGLVVSGNPLSLYSLYGVIALTGIAVNSAIVLIDAANQRRRDGMGELHAAVYAARRRVVPILITTSTTIGGLLSLALGLGGKSLIWGPVASAIVWGLTISTALTLFVVPLLYRLFMRRSVSSRPPRESKPP
jgi:multidrug efflux pump subunit AcrB